ncbi:hypothetical protein D1610_15330 [Sphingomonas gilva]|uniref:Uncharacterized protein n=1 Tax=Sphingomonas gilva TaxID=2305907 RepID=A0A396RSA2_9SPHN|nr:hypothetical protein [Sphingomonas gilva]RHW16471.1 hypothetical protein D1610_15330 [Sphingomonas gilva]
MAHVQLAGPVGLRYNAQNVLNHADDQRKVIDLLSSIADGDGGKQQSWGAPPLTGSTGACPRFLTDAIWDFQRHWKSKGRFRNIDGVVDPGGNTLKMLNLLSSGIPPSPEPDRPPIPPNRTHVRIPGTWQVTNMWSSGLGEVGLIGSVAVEVTPPDEKKFIVYGAGAGVGYSLDPVALIKGLKTLQALNPFASKDLAKAIDVLEMLAKGVGFGIGDYLQAFGVPLTSVTGGVLIPNPINRYIGRPMIVSRYTMTEAGNANFAVASAGGGFGAGMEGGLLGFGGPAVGPAMLLCPVLGYYGTSGVTLKFGIGGQVMLYSIVKVV